MNKKRPGGQEGGGTITPTISTGKEKVKKPKKDEIMPRKLSWSRKIKYRKKSYSFKEDTSRAEEVFIYLKSKHKEVFFRNRDYQIYDDEHKLVENELTKKHLILFAYETHILNHDKKGEDKEYKDEDRLKHKNLLLINNKRIYYIYT